MREIKPESFQRPLPALSELLPELPGPSFFPDFELSFSHNVFNVFLHAFGYRHKLVTQSDTAGH